MGSHLIPDLPNISWEYDLWRALSMDKSKSRTAIEGTYDLVGADCTLDGGLRPFPGFERYYDLTGDLDSVEEPVSTAGQARQALPSFVTPTYGITREIGYGGFHPVDFRISSTRSGYGFIYRVRDADNPSVCRYFIEYRISGSSTTFGPRDLIGWQSNGDKQMDVAVAGKFIYLLVKGSQPVRITVEFTPYSDGVASDSAAFSQSQSDAASDIESEVISDGFTSALASAEASAQVSEAGSSRASDSGSDSASDSDKDVALDLPGDGEYILKVVENTGPGKAPAISNGINGGVGAVSNAAAAFVPVPVPTDSEVSASARLTWVGFSGTSADRTAYTWDDIENAPPFVKSGIQIHDIFDLGLWVNSPPQNSPTSSNVLYVFPNGENLQPITSVRKWKSEDRQFGDPAAIEKGEYTFSYQLYNSKTGLASAPAPATTIAAPPYLHGMSVGDIKEGPYKEATNPISGDDVSGTLYNDFTPVMFAALDITYDPDQYDRVLLYRSAGEAYPNLTANLFLDGDYRLADYQPDAAGSSPGSGYKRAVIFYTLLNSELPGTFLYEDDFTFDQNMPFAGAGLFHDATLLLSNVGQENPRQAGDVGVIRWSTPGLFPELISPFSREGLTQPTEEILKWHSVGPQALGLSQRRPYMARRENTSVRVYPLHKGFGTGAQEASTELGEQVYYVTPKGIKVIDGNGSFADIPFFDKLIIRDWAATLSSVSVAYDEVMSCIFVMNATLGKALVFWFNNGGGRSSELWDLPFTSVSEATISTDLTDGEARVENRAAFVFPVKDTVGGSWVFRVMTVDHDRSRTQPYQFLDATGDLRYTFSSAVQVSNAEGTFYRVTVTGTIGNFTEGSYLYVLDGVNAGSKAKIVRKASSTQVDVDTSSFNFTTESAGTRLGISPVYVRWATGQLPIRDGSASPTTYFRVRTIRGIRASFVDVGGSAASDTTNNDARWAAIVFEGNGDTPAETAFPINVDETKRLSVEDGPSEIVAAFGASSDGTKHGRSHSALFPGIEVYVPELDYTVVGLRVDGDGRAVERDTRP